MKYKIETAKKSDNPGIVNLLRKYAAEFWFWEVEDRIDIMTCPEFYHERNGNFWVVKDWNKIIASVWTHELEYEWKKSWFLRRLYVDEDYRGYGLWKLLLLQVEEFCRNQWWDYLIFWVDTLVDAKWGVRKFYVKFWYEEFFDNIPQYLIDDNDEWYYRKKM